MFCSYIIPTIGRVSLDFAIKSVLEQDFTQADFEVIVVNDSGSPLPTSAWLASNRVRVLNTNKCERSFARNSGAATATAEYLAFLDDDDWILPGALESFWWLANQKPDAVWLYGGIQIVDEFGGILGEINSGLSGNCFAQIMGGSWAPLQASMIRADAFFEIGGFNPLITGTEDEDLCRRLAYHGSFANTPDTVACLFRGQSWNTSTNYLRAPADTKYSRDLLLSQPKAFQRLLASADSSYWYGRILRIYSSTIWWNLKKKRLFTALDRLFHFLMAGIFSSKHFFSKDYWLGMRAHHVPETLHYVMLNQARKSQEKV
jgi:glycosyltransferase involved in cell wall biosynthesis